ncbi:MAG: NAD kinase, partial [Nocardioides sp.]|uniref:NAD kinase n=1 Tax=Nocardioides sp. TaxID=35761 RepID=UPI003F1055F1
MAESTRRILLLAHTGRDEARKVARECLDALTGHGVTVRMIDEEALALDVDPAAQHVERVPAGSDVGAGCEVALVVGGDGSILRAAEFTHASGTPILGINLGHVGFLAEVEEDDVATTIDAIVERRYTIHERLTVDVSVLQGKEVVYETFALNEASVEKAARERMLEVVVEVDGRPLSRFGCDGVVCATPTGSTAYNFSAGGPVVWPQVEALLMVPLSAHALFARPMVVAPTSVLA